MMKKKLVTSCAVLLALLLTACGGDGGDKGSEDPGQSSVQDSVQDASAEESDAASEGSDAAPEEGDASSEGGDASSEGTAGSGNYQEGWSQEMGDLRTAAVEAADGGYWPDMELQPDMLEMSFGITADMYEDYMAEMPQMSAHVDTLLIVRAKEDKLEAVQEAVEAYREAKVSDTMQYPMNIGKTQASRVETIGNYVMFVMLGGDTTEAEEQGDEAVVALCQERNDKVIEAIRSQLE